MSIGSKPTCLDYWIRIPQKRIQRVASIGRGYKFSERFGPYVKACTSFYKFSRTKKLTSWVGYWAPTQPHSCLFTSHCWAPTPFTHYRLAICVTVWSDLSNEASIGTLSRQCKIEAVWITQSSPDICWCNSIITCCNGRSMKFMQILTSTSLKSLLRPHRLCLEGSSMVLLGHPWEYY